MFRKLKNDVNKKGINEKLWFLGRVCDSYENKNNLQTGIVFSQIPATAINQCGT